jgi:acyl carrier protein
MDPKQELLLRLKKIISEHLAVEQEEVTEQSTWFQLGADSLDRLEMSLAIEKAFKVEIPHTVGEQLNSVGQTVEHLSAVIAERKAIGNFRIEAATTSEQWTEMMEIRTRVFANEYGFSFRSLPGPGEKGVWHFLARDNHDAIGTLSVVDTTGNRQVHQRYRLDFGNNDRVARYAQLAILKPYRGRGIFKMLIDSAHNAVIRPHGFTVSWLIYPAARARSSILTQSLGFTAEVPLLGTEFGSCHVLVCRESNNGNEQFAPARVALQQDERRLASFEV